MWQLLIPVFCLVLFPFHLECWSFSSFLDPTCFSVRLTPGIEQQQTLPVSHSSMRFSQAFSFTSTKVVRDQPLLLSLCQRKRQTQRGSVSYPAWVLGPVVDRAGQSNTTTPVHNHNSLPMVPNQKQFCPALEIVITTGGVLESRDQKSGMLLDIPQCRGQIPQRIIQPRMLMVLSGETQLYASFVNLLP